MNNLFQLLRESWQIALRSKLLWLFSFAPVLADLVLRIWNQAQPSGTPLDLTLSCSGLILVVFSSFMILFNSYALPYCAGMAIQGEEYEFMDVWNGFKANALKFLLLGLLSTAYVFTLYILNSIVWRILTHTIENLNTIWWLVSLILFFALFGGPVILSPYGLLFQKIGVFQSFIKGFKVFSLNRIAFTSIYSISYIAYFAIGLMVVVSLTLNGQAINYESYYNLQMSSIYFSIITSLLNFIILPIITVAFALTYFKISPIKV